MPIVTQTIAPTRQQPLVDEENRPTLRASEWFHKINLLPPIQGTGDPEGVIEAEIGQWFIDTSVGSSEQFLYIKQLAAISGDKSKGWRITPNTGAFQITKVTASYTALTSDNGIAATGTFNVTLFASAEAEDYLTVKSVTPGGTITVLPDGSETIEGASSKALTAGQSVTLMPVSAGWLIK